MNRFFVEKIDPKDKQIILSDYTQAHHLRDVLRIKPLELVAVFDNQGNEYIASVIEIGADAIKLEVKERKPLKDSGIKITLACAIPKKVKMDDIVDKLTQLGVDRIIPLLTERVIVKIDAKNAQSKLSRWRKIAQSAAEQSQRNIIPVIDKVKSLEEVLKEADKFDLKIIPTLEENIKKLSLRGAIAKKQFQSIIVLIGPEGDFTPGEVAKALELGFLPI
ncbi:MAG: RsmE family RNA methyltransferase, partial [Candidatus Omnitrophota bacterium]|nr:RsmE family RNA methyltransferase [Candidatus Omnitrophota bacterium]